MSTHGGSARPARMWTEMTPGDFDRDAPLRPAVGGGTAVVPAVPDECGTVPLFGDETPPPRPQRTGARPAAYVEQDGLF